MIFFFFIMIFVIGCSDNSTNNKNNVVTDTVFTDTFTDARDGKQYSVIKINSQVWMSENLNASTYRNGDTIRYARNRKEWEIATSKKEGAWCYYNYDPKNGEIYGKLYNFYAVDDSRGLAPKGYHIPSDAEWTVLTDFLGGELISGFKMKSKSGWFADGNGDNRSGFNGLPGGFCNWNGDFFLITVDGNFWSSSDDNYFIAWCRGLNYGDTRVGRYDSYDKACGLSVRCLRD